VSAPDTLSSLPEWLGGFTRRLVARQSEVAQQAVVEAGERPTLRRACPPQRD
jgi:hypothetical protein